ncbi:peptidase C1A papain [Thiorhodococcus drewsii AZ1]|uniref:Peptidase C1A papain n=1 Tax=Thiorhodococcus drewsii AZ1 TaxID=765913 RepID=G2E7R7_9GAMM|nr:C1 family peptidase [Thiorhodococcus drewsii]EGV27865.1 peptidase C1A papain [Thiorhodococcus drewsii AZ1]
MPSAASRSSVSPRALPWFLVQIIFLLVLFIAQSMAGNTARAAAAVDRTTSWRVAEIYIATMGYAPDNEGLQYWVGQIESGGWTPTTVAQSFFDQPLVQVKYPASQSDSDFIDALYLNIYERAADADGKNYWLQALQSGMARNSMVIALIEGGWDNPLAAEDMARFANLIEVARAFADEQSSRGIIYSDLTDDEKTALRQAGASVLSGITSDTATRDSAIAQIPSLLDTLVADNAAPVASDLSVQANPSVPLTQVTLIATDADNDTLSYLLVSPATGTGYDNAYVASQSGNLYVTLDGSGQDFSLVYRASDGLAYSAPATVTVSVISVTDDRETGEGGVDPTTYGQFPIINPYGDLLGDPGDSPQLPSSVDLSSSFPAPGNQGGQGSCVAWATAYALKGYQEKVENNWELNRLDHLFSPAFIYNQIRIGGCGDGSLISDALDLLKSTGVSTWNAMPYTESECSTQPSSTAVQEAANFKIASWGRLQGNDSIKAELANHRPVVIGIPVYDSFMNLSGSNSVYNALTGQNHGGHAITIVGYDDNRYGGAFKVINSWGTDWGDNGYFWLTYDLGRQGVIQQAYSAQDVDNPNDPDPVDPEPTPANAPNLQIMSWSADYDSAPGGAGSLQWRVANTGTGVAPAGAYVNLMLSENADISSGDVFVVYETIPFDLDAGDFVYRDENNAIGFHFPDTLVPGIYYLALWVDDLNAVEESNEDDNVSFGDDQVTIASSLPDLAVQYWYAEWDGAGSGTFLYEIVNQGQSTAPAGWDVNLVLTPDETLGNGDDYYLFYEDTPFNLEPGEYVYRDESIPAYFSMTGLPAGIYYMAVWANDLSEIAESNVRNNISWGWGPISWGLGSSEVLGADRSDRPVISRYQTGERSCLFNGRDFSEKPVELRKVEIVATPSGGRQMRLVDEGKPGLVMSSSASTAPGVMETGSLRLPKTIESRDIGVFPVGEEHSMP